MQIKTTLRYHFSFVRLDKIKNYDHTFCWEAREILVDSADGNVNWYNPSDR